MSEENKLAGGAEARLSVAVFGANEDTRKTIVDAFSARPGVRIREFASLPSLESIPSLAQQYGALVFDADGDAVRVLQLIESVVADGRTYLMAYSGSADMKVAIRFMRAGVREFFTMPLDPGEVAGAVGRVAEHQELRNVPEKDAGKLFIFLGTKGGCGVTTLASNFALALAQESEQKTLLVDLGLPLGDVAINLGLKSPQYSVFNALGDAERLDPNFLKSLVTTHETGLDVLAAPNEFHEMRNDPEALNRLAAVTRQTYDYVVVDGGSRADLIPTGFVEQSSTIFLVTQVGISELRNAHRMITQFFIHRGDELQIVLNRYATRTLLFDDAQITKTLTRPAQWKVPDDWAAARRTRNTATPMVLVDSAISQVIREMARNAAGITSDKEGKRGLFRLLR